MKEDMGACDFIGDMILELNEETRFMHPTPSGGDKASWLLVVIFFGFGIKQHGMKHLYKGLASKFMKSWYRGPFSNNKKKKKSLQIKLHIQIFSIVGITIMQINRNYKFNKNASSTCIEAMHGRVPTLH